MNEIDLALLRHEQRKGNEKIKKTPSEEDNKISKIFTKILLSVIFILVSTIYIKLDPENLNYFKKHLFESNLTFTKMNNWYHDTFGNILPTVKEPQDTLVSSNLNSSAKKEKYLDGYKIESSAMNPISSIASGILVYMGEKEGYGNTLIIQGVDGVDIWYGGLTDTNLKLYDYIDANTILGNTKENFYYLLFQKSGEYLTYEDYFNEISY